MPTALTTQKPDIASVKDIFDYFPIGSGVDYYPEYQTAMTMQSVVLGYEINGHLIFKQQQIVLDLHSGQKARLTLKLDHGDINETHLHSFGILLPANAGEEYKLDFISKSSLGSRGQFRNGNSISLIARMESKGVATLETTVRESTLAKDGFFKGHRLVILDVISSSLEFAEQRTQYRVNTRIPVKIKTADAAGSALAALLCDFSEQFLKIKVSNDERMPSALSLDATVTISLVLENIRKTYEISGRIKRAEKGHILLQLQRIGTNGSPLKDISLMDALGLKAGILQHPNTQA